VRKVHLRVNRDFALAFLAVGIATATLGLVYGPSILNYLIVGLGVGSIYVLGATGLTLVYSVRKFANFAHGDMMTFGAYMVFLANVMWRVNILWGVGFAVVMTALVGLVMELLVFRKLALRGPVQSLVASIGVTLILQNVIKIWFGTEIHNYNTPQPQDIVLVQLAPFQVITVPVFRGAVAMAVSAALVLFLHLLLKRTTLGKAMRATSDNADLARTSGIKTRNVILWTWVISGGMAAVAGALLALGTDIRTSLGFDVLLFLFAAAIIGGIGSPYGAMVGGLLVGIAQQLGVAFLAWLGRPDVLHLEQPTAYSPVIGFVIMIVVLILRPEGLASGRPTGMGQARRRFSLSKLLRRGEPD
jgi:branched-chain amino acid transport system permease protein